ncbi:MAG: hypothetical protein QXQ63_04345 [Candidatus Bathyarchaeia archaeon]
MLKEDKVGVTTYSQGRGFQQYYAFVCPCIPSEGQFTLLLKLSNQKMRYGHSMEIPAEIAISVKQAPTFERLPPVQLIVATAKKKKTEKQQTN